MIRPPPKLHVSTRDDMRHGHGHNNNGTVAMNGMNGAKMHVYTGADMNGSEPTTPRTPSSSNRFDDLASPNGGDGLQFQLSPIGGGRGGGRSMQRLPGGGTFRSSGSDTNLNRLKQFSFESQQAEAAAKRAAAAAHAGIMASGKNGIGASTMAHAAFGGGNGMGMGGRPPLHGHGHAGLMGNTNGNANGYWTGAAAAAAMAGLDMDSEQYDAGIGSLTISRTTSGGGGGGGYGSTMNGRHHNNLATRSPIRERKSRAPTPTTASSSSSSTQSQAGSVIAGDEGAAAVAIPCGHDGIHENVSCSNCLTMPIVGPRYRCIICVNFQLCSACEVNCSKPGHSAYHPVHHPLLKIRCLLPPSNVPPLIADRSAWIHRGYECGVCKNKQIQGFRHLCTVCDITICEFCEYVGCHDISHSRLKYAPPNVAEIAATGASSSLLGDDDTL